MDQRLDQPGFVQLASWRGYPEDEVRRPFRDGRELRPAGTAGDAEPCWPPPRRPSVLPIPEVALPCVDGFLLPVPKRNLPAYRRLASKAGKVRMELGPPGFHECAGDDLTPRGALPFPRVAKSEPGETVVMFSWIVFKSRAHRDRVNAKAMADPRRAKMPAKTPFDLKRMACGGFRTLVSL